MSLTERYIAKLKEEVEKAESLEDKAIAYSNLKNFEGLTSWSIAEAFQAGYRLKEKEIENDKQGKTGLS